MTLATIGWVVVHSLWQWTLIAGVTALAAGLIRDRRASARYTLECAGLVAMIAAAVATLATAGLPPRSNLGFRILYSFDGALILPEVAPRGSAILRTAAALWLAGVTIASIRVAIEWRRARAFRRSGTIDPGGAVAGTFAGLRDELGITRAVTLRCSDRATVPMLIGWRRPLVLLPASTAATLADDQMRAVLAHELGHVRRRDDIANLLQVAADVLMFHHPAARWVSRRIRTEREYSCDDVAVEATGDAARYARALAAIEDSRSDCRFAVAAASGTLLDRIQRILDQPRQTLTASRGAWIFAVSTAVAGALLVAAINVPPPSVPAGVRMRRPMPGRSINPPAGQPSRDRQAAPAPLTSGALPPR